jgi:hypothetical protein
VTVPDDIDAAAEKPMSTWSRTLIGITGFALASAGVIAVFVKYTNVAGVPLLIVAGAAFLYVALTGQRLIQVSKDGVTFGKAARLEKTLREANADPDLSYESKARLADIAEDNGIRLPHPSGLELELQVQQTFERIGQQFGFDLAPRVQAHDVGTDFVLINKEGRTLAVEVKGRIRVRQFAQAVRALASTNWDQKMLVIDGTFPEQFADPYRAEGIWIIGWEPDSEARFAATLRQMGFI